MHENRRTVAVALACALLPPTSFADGQDEALKPCCGRRVDGYRNFTQQVLARCSHWVRVRYRDSVSIVNAEKLRSCIDGGLRNSRTELDAALDGVHRKKAREALRAYQAVFESALTGIAPTLDEAAAAYDQRQISLRHLLAHAWTRYELEEG